MATPQWEAIKGYIIGLGTRDLEIAGAAVGFQYDASRDARKNASALCSHVYNLSKSKAADHGSLTAAYDFNRNKLQSAVAQASGKSDDYRGEKNQQEAQGEQEAAPPPVTADGNDVKAMLDKLAAAFEARMTQAGALTPAEVAALIKAQVSAMPALRIEVTQGGEVVGTVEGLQHKQFTTLLKAVSKRQSDGFFPNVWIAGPAGSGKTTAARQVAKAFKRGFEFNGALSMSHEVLGFIDAGGAYHSTSFRKGYTSASVYLFDECDGCADNSPLLALNAALANGVASFPDGMQERHSDSVIIAGANTFGLGATADYVGRAKIDAAFLDRFPIKLFWEYDEELERSFVSHPEAALAVQAARRKAREHGLKVLITPRSTIAMDTLLTAGFSMEEAKTLTYRGMLTADQIRMVG